MAEGRSARTNATPDARTAGKFIPEKLITEQLTFERRYTIKDFTALRAYVERIAPAVSTHLLRSS
ncbi:hypothetical protein AWB80_08095 [Caballeronia pedi]|uniref:Uncharacterized protein n=1 Tax=Caballeronia pedi TaxID=1777141 RepID=A0A158E3C2_9BURK|nr:hypothetical protein [Caballeronia pedi]SAL01304.1 hypothetical protein AWB80_08095 [Caballeronia pedi]